MNNLKLQLGHKYIDSERKPWSGFHTIMERRETVKTGVCYVDEYYNKYAEDGKALEATRDLVEEHIEPWNILVDLLHTNFIVCNGLCMAGIDLEIPSQFAGKRVKITVMLADKEDK